MFTLIFTAIITLALVAHFNGSNDRVERGWLSRMLDSRGVLVFVFVVTFIVLWLSWAAWNPIPVVHDEMAYVLQAQIYARGHWSLPSPPLPLFWEQPHVIVEPRLAAKYFPGHPLLLAIGALVGWMPLMPLVLQSLCAVLLFVLARRLVNGAVAFVTWHFWLFTPMVLYFGASYFSEATTTLCWLGGWYALLEWRSTRRTRWLALVALCTGWDAIARPLTGVAYAIPIAVIVLWDVIRLKLWRDFAIAFAVGCAVMAILPLWSAHTTGDWRLTPLTYYTRQYMPYDVPGFGLDTTPPLHSITPDLKQLNNVYSAVHPQHVPRNLLRIFLTRVEYLLVSIWGTTYGVMMVFAVLGLITLTATSAFAVASGVVLLLTYMVFATPAQWTLYYYESVPAFALLTASGMAWAASLIGRPRGVPNDDATSWRSKRWTRALVSAAFLLTLPGIVSLQVNINHHIGDRKFLTGFNRLLASIHDERAIVFVRYAATHTPHITFVRNTANLEGERVWVVYDRGDKENAQLLSLAAGRKSYLFDEIAGKIYVYDPTEAHP
jgi:hypothetical protein